MEDQPAGPEKDGRTMSALGKLGVVAGALGLIPLLYAGWTVASGWWHSRGTVELAGSFPGKVWRPATPSQFSHQLHSFRPGEDGGVARERAVDEG